MGRQKEKYSIQYIIRLMYSIQYMPANYHLYKLGQRLRALRHSRGLTQVELAQRAGVTRLKVIAVESGAESPAIAGYARVAAALGAELDVAPMTRPTLDELAEVFDGRGA